MEMFDIYNAQKDARCDALILQTSEVAAAKWDNKGELNELIDFGVFIPFYYARQIFDCLHFDEESGHH